MPRSPSGSYSPKTPTRRSGSSTPTRSVPAPLAPAPPSSNAAPRALRPARRTRIIAASLLVVGFIATHIALDLFLDLAPATYLGVRGFQLLEIFYLWIPLVFIAAAFGFGLGRGIPAWIRFVVLFAYAGGMIALAANAPTGCAPGSNTGAQQAAAAGFDLMLRFVPVPAAFFLFANGRHQWTLSRCFGVALMFGMLWRTLYYNFDNLLVIACGGATNPATPTNVLYINFFVSVLWDVLYPLLGLMFFLHRVPGVDIRPAWGDQLERLLRPFNAWTRRSFGIDTAWGGILFVVDFVSAVALANLLENTPTGEVGNDSNVFNLITADQVFLISIVAGVGEELVFRGLLQSALQRLIGRDFLGSSLAILIQATPFAIVHSGYNDLNHLILPFAFGVFVGYVFRYFGIIPAILIHLQIDVFAFGGSWAALRDGAASGTLMYGALTALFIANFAFGVVFLFLQLLTWWEGPRRVWAVLVRS